jgi:signal transduction histidine kinase
VSGWLTAVGWVVALGSGVAAVLTRRALAARAEAIADACHELRGPLTSARLGLELGARLGRLSGQQVRAIELELERAALALEDFRGDAPRRREWVAVRELVSDSVEAWRPVARDRGSSVELRWHGGQAWVIGERVRLAQATGNLIANAIEHGAGAIEVTGRFEQGAVKIEVLDAGPGLPAPVADLTRRRKPGGRGRGLAIVSSIAAAHGGRLSAAPTSHGARVVLALPALASPSR